jgi:hypothetical protein
MQAQKIRMTLTGALTGKTIVLRKRQFVDGVYEDTIPANDLIGVKKYFTASYQVKFEIVAPEVEAKEEVKEEPKVEVEAKEEVKEEALNNEAIRVDDAAVMSKEEVEDKQEQDEANLPNHRQQEIIAAVNKIDKEKWIEQDTNPHPKVADVASIMDDPTVTKEEIVEVIETWLS